MNRRYWSHDKKRVVFPSFKEWAEYKKYWKPFARKWLRSVTMGGNFKI